MATFVHASVSGLQQQQWHPLGCGRMNGMAVMGSTQFEHQSVAASTVRPPAWLLLWPENARPRTGPSCGDLLPGSTMGMNQARCQSGNCLAAGTLCV
jgi:hypothetical protein